MVQYNSQASPSTIGPIPSADVLSPEHQEMVLTREAVSPPSVVYGTQAVNAYSSSTNVTTFKVEPLKSKKNPDAFTTPLKQRFVITPRALKLCSYSVLVEYGLATSAEAFGGAPADAFDLDSGLTYSGKYFLSMLEECMITIKKGRLVEFFSSITQDIKLAIQRYNPGENKSGRIISAQNDGVTILPPLLDDEQATITGLRAKDMIRNVGQHKQKVQVPALKSFLPGGPNIYGTILMDHTDWSDVLISGDGAATAGMKGYETINSDNYFNPSLIQAGEPYNAETMFHNFSENGSIPEYTGSINGFKVCMIPNIDDDLDLSYNDLTVEVPENDDEDFLLTSYIPILSPQCINTYSFAKLHITDNYPGNGCNTSKLLTVTSHHGSLRTNGRHILLQPRNKRIVQTGSPLETANTGNTRLVLEKIIDANRDKVVLVEAKNKKGESLLDKRGNKIMKKVLQIDPADLLEYGDNSGHIKTKLNSKTEVFDTPETKEIRERAIRDAEGGKPN